MKKTLKSFVAAAAFFIGMLLIGVGTAPAQIDLLHQKQLSDTNMLLLTTGPNTVGAHRLLVDADIAWRYGTWLTAMPTLTGDILSGRSRSSTLAAGLNLRYGIGRRFELELGVSGYRDHYKVVSDDMLETLLNDDIYKAFIPSLGLKVNFFNGEGWVPQMALKAGYGQRVQVMDDGSLYTAGYLAMPYVGMEFRNHLGQHWVLDYSVGLGLPQGAWAIRNGAVTYSIYGRWLPTDRMMVGLGLEDGWGRAEVRWQAAKALQLRAQACVSMGGVMDAIGADMLHTYASAGVGWMLN